MGSQKIHFLALIGKNVPLILSTRCFYTKRGKPRFSGPKLMAAPGPLDSSNSAPAAAQPARKLSIS